jgi:L-amino acid N-acyltransferase YncA
MPTTGGASGTPVIVRAAREDDAQAIVDILSDLISRGRYTVMDQPLSLEEQIAFIRAFPQRGVFHVAACRTTRQVLGLQDVAPLAAERPAFAHVGEVSPFVRPGAQGQGVGRSLCQATSEAASRQGFRKITATVRADNPRAVAFYLGQGFRPVGTLRQHARVGGGYVDEVLLETFLD